MNIYLYIDSEYKKSLWCHQSYKAISEEITKKRYQLITIDSNNIYSVDFNRIYGSEQRRILLVLGTSIVASNMLTEYLIANSIHVIYINHQNSMLISSYSNIIVDYVDGMRTIVNYLSAAKRNKIALYGINRDSSTDMIKNDFFIDYKNSIGENGKDDIFYNAPSIIQCFDDFALKMDRYNSVICANDIVAFSLIKNLRMAGYRVPEDYYVVSFGDSILSQLGEPSLTTVSVDHRELGKQAIFAYSYLYRASANITMSAKVRTKLYIRESTAYNTPYTKPLNFTFTPEVLNNNFYNGPETGEILSVEHLLTRCDSLDFQILLGLLNGIPYSDISEHLFVSENVVSYRIRRMCKTAGVEQRKNLLNLISPYISRDAIKKHIAKED